MKTDRMKIFAIVLFAISLLFISRFGVTQAKEVSISVDDPAASFKTKCAACHTPTASKFYDPAKPEDEQVQAILKGKKGEKPPYMPGFEAKGMTADEAKALATYMKGLRGSAQ